MRAALATRIVLGTGLLLAALALLVSGSLGGAPLSFAVVGGLALLPALALVLVPLRAVLRRRRMRAILTGLLAVDETREEEASALCERLVALADASSREEALEGLLPLAGKTPRGRTALVAACRIAGRDERLLSLLEEHAASFGEAELEEVARYVLRCAPLESEALLSRLIERVQPAHRAPLLAARRATGDLEQPRSR